LFATARGDAVVFGAFAFIGKFPRGGDPSFGLQPMKSGIERARFDLEQVLRSPLNVFGDGVTVGGTGEESAKDEDIEGTLEKLNAVHYVESLRYIV
jgi:hypothetical protein